MLQTPAPSKGKTRTPEGRAIQLALHVRNWSQEYLSELTGISQTRLSRCLNGVQRFRPDELREIWLNLSSEDPQP